jgi:hypothetical protein
MGNCSSTSNCNPCGPDFNAINQLATKAGAYARQANTYSVDAQNAFLEFNALYLGAFAVAPTVDNEGDPLQTGALYWDTALTQLFAWSGTSWVVAANFTEFTPFLANGSTEPRNLVTREADVVNVKDFGAVGDGVADDTAAIQAAMNAIASANKKGGKIEFPVGTYKITSTITFNYPMIIEGIGNSCVIAPNFASGDAFVLTATVDLNRDDGVQFFNIHFKTSVTKTSGYYININGASFTSIKQCKFFNGYDGIGITGTASANTRIKDCHFANNTNYNIYNIVPKLPKPN